MLLADATSSGHAELLVPGEQQSTNQPETVCIVVHNTILMNSELGFVLLLTGPAVTQNTLHSMFRGQQILMLSLNKHLKAVHIGTSVSSTVRQLSSYLAHQVLILP